MLLDDAATHLAGSGLGLSTTGNLFKVPFPESAPDVAVCLVEYGGEPAVRSMGPSTGAPAFEVPRFQALVRAPSSEYSSGRNLADQVHNALDHCSTTISGRRYYFEALAPPAYVGEDAAHRHRWATNVRAMKDRG